jgi:predicted kinase
VLYDLAFLVMDLLHRNLRAHANAALNAWLERLPHYEALPLLPLFLSCRAAIRAKVSITAAGMTADPGQVHRLEDGANAYLDRALSLIAPGTGAIVAIGGLSGSGKSTLARRLAPDIGRPPGALVLRSDVARKRRFGVEPTERLPAAAYAAPVSAAVYGELVRSALEVARAGYVAIVDAVLATEALRRAVRDAAVSQGVPFAGLWLDAPLETMEARLAARGVDASDANAAVLRQQVSRATVPADWERIDASGSIDQVADTARGLVTTQIQAMSNTHQPID